MSDTRRVTVAVDAVGGDHAPAVVLEGVAAALAADSGLEVLLTGSAHVIEAFAAATDRCVAVATTQIIAMDENPAIAVRTKKDSSIVVGCRLVREGRAQAFFSAGSTGACMAAAMLVMGRIKGIPRPAIATVIPTSGSPVVLLDVGANADYKPEHLVHFARMGAVYARIVLDAQQPRVALLNIGEEPTKGSLLAIEAHELMRANVSGFIGNVALKLLEGVSRSLLGQVKEAMTANALTTLAAAVLKPSLTRLKHRLDPDTYGGAPLLGVDGVCIIGHGSSGAVAVASALRVAAQAVRGGLTERISDTFHPHDPEAPGATNA